MATTVRMKVGDKVVVPWGLDEIIGEVLEVYGPSGHRQAYVRVPTLGPSGETLAESDISFPVTSLRLAATA